MTTPRPAHAQTPGSSSSSIPRSLDRQKVLDEDEYTAALSHIIARDFFPSLVHLDATNEYLDSVQSKNPSLIEASVRRLESLSTPTTRQRERAPNQTPSQTPYTYGPSDTPLPYRTPRDATTGESSSKRPRFDANMSLDAFQAQYTSEDNASFTQILEDENQKRKKAYSWAWDAQRRVEAAKARSLEMKARMMIEGPVMPGVKGKLLIEPPLPTAGLLTAAGEEMDVDGHEEALDDLREEREVALVLVEAEQEEPVSTVSTVSKEVARRDEAVVDVMAPQKDTRSAGVDGWHFKTRNSLMFPPDSDSNPHDHRKPPPDGIVPKLINLSSTRMEEDDLRPSRGASEPPSPTRSRIDAAIAGTPYRPRSPTINSYSLVAAMPSPTPSELGPAAVKQLMTWGTLNSTPRILQAADDMDPSTASAAGVRGTAVAPFHVRAPSSREALSMRLSNKAGRDIRERANLLNGTPRASVTTPKGSALGRASRSQRGGDMGTMAPPSLTPGPRGNGSEAPGGLTPAARRLLTKTTLGSAAARRAEVMERNSAWDRSSSAAGSRERELNKVRWTPTPSPVTRRGL